VIDVVNRDQVTKEQVGLLMAGVRPEINPAAAQASRPTGLDHLGI
jgi:hypothetical protein